MSELFSWLEFGFMRNALIAVLLLAPMYGLLGTMVISNKMAFFSESLGHSALTGVSLGVLLGMSNPLLAMVIFGIFFAVTLVLFKNHGDRNADTTIAVFSSAAIALGLVLLSFTGGTSQYNQYITGDLLSISKSDLKMLTVVFVVTLVVWAYLYNRLLVVVLNPALASSRGIKVNRLEMIFTVLIAVIVMISIRWVGLLVINAMLILPAAAAKNIANNLKSFSLYAVLISIVCSLIGLVLSFYGSTATGATIVMVMAVGYVFTFLMKIFRKRV